MHRFVRVETGEGKGAMYPQNFQNPPNSCCKFYVSIHLAPQNLYSFILGVPCIFFGSVLVRQMLAIAMVQAKPILNLARCHPSLIIELMVKIPLENGQNQSLIHIYIYLYNYIDMDPMRYKIKGGNQNYTEIIYNNRVFFFFKW